MDIGQKNLLDIYITNIENVIERSDRVKEVFQKFDGKVVNARLKNAIEEALGKDFLILDMMFTHSQFSFDIYMRNRCVNGEGCAYYLPDNKLYFCMYTSRRDIVREKDDNFFYYMDENGNLRLGAKNAIMGWNGHIERWQNHLIDVKKYDFDTVNEIKYRLQELKNKHHKILYDIPGIIRDIFEIER